MINVTAATIIYNSISSTGAPPYLIFIVQNTTYKFYIVLRIMSSVLMSHFHIIYPFHANMRQYYRMKNLFSKRN